MKKFLAGLMIFAGLVSIPRCCLASAVIFSGDDVKALKQNIDLYGVAKVMSGTDNPTSVAKNAPKGSIYMDVTNGNVFKKNDAGSSTNWTQVATGTITGLNLVENPDFEAGILDWTASGGTFAQETTDELFGNASAAWTPSGSQTMTSDAVAIPKGLYGQNCEMTFYYQGGDSNYTAQIYDGSNVLNEIALVAASSARRVQISFICPSSGNIQARLSASGAATKIIVDSVRISNNETIGVVDQAEFYGAIKWSTTTNCQWQNTTTGSFVDFPTDADCDDNPITYSENAIADSSNPGQLPQIRLKNVGPGRYVFVAIGSFTVYKSSGQEASSDWRIYDGTSAFDVPMRTSIYDADSLERQIQLPQLRGEITYTEAKGDVTLKIQSKHNVSNTQINTDYNGFLIAVYKYPLAESTVLRPDKQGWYISASVSGADVSLPLVDQLTYTGIENGSLSLALDSGSSPAYIACSSTEVASGTTCTGNESVGFSVPEIPSAGKYEICAYFGSILGNPSAAMVGLDFFKIVETQNNSQTVLTSGTTVQAYSIDTDGELHGETWKICDIFNLSSSGQKTFRLFNYYDLLGGTTATHALQINGSTAGRNIKWTMIPISQNMPMPLIVNSVASKYNGAMYFHGAAIAGAGTPSIVRQSGTWINSITDEGVGIWTLNFASGVFASDPYCTCSVQTGGGGYICGISSPGSSSVKVYTTNSSGTATDLLFDILCYGPR